MELTDLKGLGSVRMERLRAMGICSLRDLLYFFPLRYEDHFHIVPVSEAAEGEVLVKGIVKEKARISYYRGLSRVSARLYDESGSIPLIWFNEPWMCAQLPLDREIMLYGRIQNRNNIRSLQNPRIVTMTGWFPVYRQIRGIPGRTLQQMILEALPSADQICPDLLPHSFCERNHLIPLRNALEQIHHPENPLQIKEAERRLGFERILMYLTAVSGLQRKTSPGWPVSVHDSDQEEFWEKMPFQPTDAQKRVLAEICRDLQKNTAMARLVQGDVGCGKTALAFGAVYLVCRHHLQAAMMAPTEILARQHYQNALALLQPFGIQCELLTGSTSAAERRRILKSLRNGECQAVFGTHALLSEGVEYFRLGLAVTDEQHRFGVMQRSRLQEKGTQSDQRVPHVLVMSATPIPRTLALILYGDLNLSLVNELPPGRKTVNTRLVPAGKREGMYRFLREMVGKGFQAYVVCPLAEESEVLEDVKSAQALYNELASNELKGLRIAKTWGKQKSEDKAETLRRFAAGEIDVLVATTVIEVGVNVPNANVMVIENAERYGLSQLHQLRGRVGRGDAESWCFLLSEDSRKLRILCETNDGFEIARRDLELRGAGDLLGTRQSGDAGMVSAFGADVRLLEEVRISLKETETRPEYRDEYEQIEKACLQFFRDNDLHIALN